jgi:hypothetical protein
MERQPARGEREMRYAVAACSMFWLLCAAPPARAAQQTLGDYTDEKQWPDTPAAQRARELLEVINARDASRAARFVNDRFSVRMRESAPMEQHISILSGLADVTGGLEFYGARAGAKLSPMMRCGGSSSTASRIPRQRSVSFSRTITTISPGGRGGS